MSFIVDTDGLKISGWFLLAFSIFASFSIIISFVHLATHLRRYTVPPQQRCIVRIILMVPNYAFWSLLALFFPQHSAYFGMLFVTLYCSYEAYALYMFFSLLMEYGGGWDRLAGVFSEHSPTKLLFPLCCKVQPNKRLLVICRQGILQYTLVKPIVSIICAILLFFGWYDEGEWNPHHNFYLYATIINNICVTVSLYCLALFYKISKEELKPYSPLIKFACIKMIVFFCYWQSVVIAVAVALEWIPTVDNLKEGEVATSIQNGLICIEMFAFSILHIVAFPSGIYSMRAMSQKPLVRESDMQGGVIKGVKDVTSQKDMILDTYHSFVPKNIRNTIAKVSKKDKKEGVELELEQEGKPKEDDFAIFTHQKIDRRGLLTDDFVQHAFKNLEEVNNVRDRSTSLEDVDIVPDDDTKINTSRR